VNGGQGQKRTADTRIFSPRHSAPRNTQDHQINLLGVNRASLGAAGFSWVTLGWKPKWKHAAETPANRPSPGRSRLTEGAEGGCVLVCGAAGHVSQRRCAAIAGLAGGPAGTFGREIKGTPRSSPPRDRRTCACASRCEALARVGPDPCARSRQPPKPGPRRCLRESQGVQAEGGYYGHKVIRPRRVRPVTLRRIYNKYRVSGSKAGGALWRYR